MSIKTYEHFCRVITKTKEKMRDQGKQLPSDVFTLGCTNFIDVLWFPHVFFLDTKYGILFLVKVFVYYWLCFCLLLLFISCTANVYLLYHTVIYIYI